MDFILLITKNEEVAKKAKNRHVKNFNIIIKTEQKNIEAIIQEYMPRYIIIAEDLQNLDDLKDYISDNTDSELIIAGKNKTRSGCIQVQELQCIEDLDQILNIISKLEQEKSEYKVINQQVTSLFSVQGGVGRTNIAFNMAYYLGKTKKLDVLLIDLNCCEGQTDLAYDLNIPKYPNMGKFLQETENSPQSLWDSIMPVKKLGTDILQAPLTIEQSDNISINIIDEIIYSARKRYDYIMVDLPHNYQNYVFEVLNLSTKIIFIFTPTMVATHRINKFLKFLSGHQDREALLNKANEDEEQIELFQQQLNINLAGSIPSMEKNHKINGFLDMQPQLSCLEKMII
ncbi:MAG: AAA family ATPase [Actinomycetota bacterium]|nr:AAA family ATPase [Actinomycetota bacterium]